MTNYIVPLGRFPTANVLHKYKFILQFLRLDSVPLIKLTCLSSINKQSCAASQQSGFSPFPFIACAMNRASSVGEMVAWER